MVIESMVHENESDDDQFYNKRLTKETTNNNSLAHNKRAIPSNENLDQA